jgi:hypothetical protein
MEHTPTNDDPIEGVVSIEGYTQSAGTGFKESLLLTVNPEDEFVDPDEDLDSVFARRGGAFEEVQSWRPVIVRIHPDAGRETVLRLLEKIGRLSCPPTTRRHRAWEWTLAERAESRLGPAPIA